MRGRVFNLTFRPTFPIHSARRSFAKIMKAFSTLKRGFAPFAVAATVFALLAAVACAEGELSAPSASAPASAPTFAVAPTITPAPTFAVAPTFAPAPTFAAAPTITPAPTFAVAPTYAPAPTFAVAPTYAPAPTFAASWGGGDSGGGVVLTVEEGSAARYLVGEELVRIPNPIVAVGETSDVSGAIVFGADGAVDAAASIVSVGLSGFVSDEDRRDNYVRSRLFDTRRFPRAELAVRETPGLPFPLPESGGAEFQIVGDLTIQGVSKSVVWDATAAFSADSAEGSASTTVTFDDFGLSKPSFAFIISVEDEIRLEMDIIMSAERE